MTRAADVSALASDPNLARLWERARRLLERNGHTVAGASVSITRVSPKEAEAIQLLLATRMSGGSIRVSLERLDAALRASRVGIGLSEFLGASGTRLRDRRAERAESAEQEEAVWRHAASHAAVARHAPIATWLEGLRAAGFLRRYGVSQSVQLLNDALNTLVELPHAGTSRAALAGSLFGDAHALDDDRPASRLVLAALACVEGTETPVRATARRDLWRRWGVWLDVTASRVLILGLRFSGQGPIASALNLFADAATPVHVTLGMLDGASLKPIPVQRLYVCENPAVVDAAAHQLRASCKPLLCVEGMPSVAARRLLETFGRLGVELLYHGDFGAGGVSIGNVVLGELGARPWRFGVGDYLDALSQVRDSTPITAPIPDAVWDSALALAMRERSREIHEEQLLKPLLSDLRVDVRA